MSRLTKTIWSLYRIRWSVARLTVALFVVWVVAADSEARLARSALRMLPDVDLAAEVRDLRATGRYGEALNVSEQGLADESLAPEARAALEHERQLTADEQSSWMRRFKDVGMGAVSGRGDTLESLAGVVAADMLVVGDVRDLVLQGSRYVADGETDKVILSLSIIGLATTLAPEVDWVPSLFKAGRKAGAISRRMGDVIIEAAKAKRFDSLVPLWKDTTRIVSKTSPAGAMRLLRHTEAPDDVAKLAAFLERSPRGAVALHLTKGQGVAWVKTVGKEGDRVILLAARKGEGGTAWLASGAGRLLLKTHPLVGLAKGVYKGSLSSLIERVLDLMGPDSWWVLPVVSAWALVEGLILSRRLGSRRVGGWTGSRMGLDAA